MSRPRKPFGNKHPGRLPSTMMKVLAAEMSDPGRLRRGKQYAKDGSVLDIVIEPGVVTAEVQGSRATPYVTSIYVRAGDGMPLRRDLDIECTCPDDDNWQDYACKHALAAMLVMADEFLLEPELLDVWRGRVGADADHADDHDRGGAVRDLPGRGAADGTDADADDDGSDGGRLAPVVPIRASLRSPARARQRAPRPAPPAPPVDPLEALTAIPADRSLPEVPSLHTDDEPPMPTRPELARVVRDALHHATAGWE